MSRSLDAGTLAAIQADETVQMFHLITMYFSTTDRITDHIHNISYDFGSGTETFTSSARLVSISNISETQDISNPTITVSITGASSADIALTQTEDYTNVRFIIRRGFYDTSGATTDANIVGRPFMIFDGKVTRWSITDNPSTGESNITWEITSHWADWEKTNGRKSNVENAQLHFPSDQSFSYIYDQIGDRVWGKIN